MGRHVTPIKRSSLPQPEDTAQAVPARQEQEVTRTTAPAAL